MDSVCCCLGSTPGKSSGRGAVFDKYQSHPNTWDKTMCQSPCAEPCCCLIGCLPCTFICANWTMRRRVLNAQDPGSGLRNYICTQGYVPKCCCGLWNPGHCGESSCPATCLCLEAICCPGMVITASRLLAMDMWTIQPDPCDNRLIRFNNFLQLLSCVCWILAFFSDAFRDCAVIIDCIADCVFFSTAGCMMAQLHHELKLRKPNLGGGPSTPDAVLPPTPNAIAGRHCKSIIEDDDDDFVPRTAEV